MVALRFLISLSFVAFLRNCSHCAAFELRLGIYAPPFLSLNHLSALRKPTYTVSLPLPVLSFFSRGLLPIEICCAGEVGDLFFLFLFPCSIISFFYIVY